MGEAGVISTLWEYRGQGFSCSLRQPLETLEIEIEFTQVHVQATEPSPQCPLKWRRPEAQVDSGSGSGGTINSSPSGVYK